MHESFESNRLGWLHQQLEGVLLLVAGEFDLAGEDGGHFFAAPGHESSMGNETNVLFEIRSGCFDDRRYQPITVRRQLRTDIKRKLVNYH